jgi:polar amino acid transport system substrate-binding protein
MGSSPSKRHSVAAGRLRRAARALLVLASAGAALAAWPGRACAQAGGAVPLRIYSIDSKPVGFMDRGRPAGFAVDLAQQIQQRIGRRDAVQIIPWARANTIAMNEANVLLLTVARTPERERRLVFVGPVFVAHVSVFALKGRGAELRALGDGIYKLRGGARRGSIFAQRARDFGYSITDEPVSSEVAARMLMSKRFELWFDGEELVGPALEKAGYARDDAELVKQLSVDDVYFGFSKGTPPDTVRAWDAALRDMKRDGAFLRLHQYWLPPSSLPPDLRVHGKSTP